MGKVPNLNLDGLNSLERKAADALKELNAGDALKSIEEHVKNPGQTDLEPRLEPSNNRCPCRTQSPQREPP